jgi:hypothetical protein
VSFDVGAVVGNEVIDHGHRTIVRSPLSEEESRFD